MINQAAPQANEKVRRKVLDILNSGQYVKGPQAEELEKNFTEIANTKYNYAVNSGTSALNLIFIALSYKPNSEIIVPANSFMASSNAVETSGYRAVFCDIDEEHMNIDPTKIEDHITDKTKAILVVHLYGTPAPMDEIVEIANKHHLDIIEDAAQAHGANYKGRKIGSLGRAAAFSLFPTKNLSVLGDGGMVCTNDEALGLKIGALRNAGRTDHADDAEYFGFNMRLSEILAGIGNVLFDDFLEETKRRQEIAQMYTDGLSSLQEIRLPAIIENTEAVYHQYTIRLDCRDELRDYLKSKQISTGIKYSIPLHLVSVYRQKYGYREGLFPIAENAAQQLLCLPMHPHLTDAEIDTIIAEIHKFFD